MEYSEILDLASPNLFENFGEFEVIMEQLSNVKAVNDLPNKSNNFINRFLYWMRDKDISDTSFCNNIELLQSLEEYRGNDLYRYDNIYKNIKNFRKYFNSCSSYQHFNTVIGNDLKKFDESMEKVEETCVKPVEVIWFTVGQYEPLNYLIHASDDYYYLLKGAKVKESKSDEGNKYTKFVNSKTVDNDNRLRLNLKSKNPLSLACYTWGYGRGRVNIFNASNVLSHISTVEEDNSKKAYFIEAVNKYPTLSVDGEDDNIRYVIFDELNIDDSITNIEESDEMENDSIDVCVDNASDSDDLQVMLNDAKKELSELQIQCSDFDSKRDNLSARCKTLETNIALLENKIQIEDFKGFSKGLVNKLCDSIKESKSVVESKNTTNGVVESSIKFDDVHKLDYSKSLDDYADIFSIDKEVVHELKKSRFFYRVPVLEGKGGTGKSYLALRGTEMFAEIDRQVHGKTYDEACTITIPCISKSRNSFSGGHDAVSHHVEGDFEKAVNYARGKTNTFCAIVLEELYSCENLRELFGDYFIALCNEYSDNNNSFSIPSNVYIIATGNPSAKDNKTRSAEQIRTDSGAIRRFDTIQFEEIDLGTEMGREKVSKILKNVGYSDELFSKLCDIFEDADIKKVTNNDLINGAKLLSLDDYTVDDVVKELKRGLVG